MNHDPDRPVVLPEGFDHTNTVELDQFAAEVAEWRRLVEERRKALERIEEIRGKIKAEIGERRGGLIGKALAVRMRKELRRYPDWDAIERIVPPERHHQVTRWVETDTYPTLS